MRISTNTIFETGTNQLSTLQSAIAKTQQQLATGRRNLTPADDPIATARALEVTQSQSVNTQYGTNRQNARSSLSQVELALGNTTALIQDVQVLTVNGGNGALSQSDRESIATELSGRLTDLLGLANSNDGTGSYLFSGFRSTTEPFTQTATGADYNGDQGQRVLQVGSSRQLPVSDSGSSVFINNATGNGTFQTGAAAANTGSGIISSGAVADPSTLTHNNYAITFAVAAGVTTYTVQNTTTGLAVPPPPAPVVPSVYSTGQKITFDGVAFDIKGAPADGDKFTVAPSKNQSLFETMTSLIATLRAPVVGGSGQATLTNGLNSANDNLTSALDNVLAVRASIGSRLKELDTLDSAGDDINIQYSATLATLQDLDTVKAISQFTQQQFTLDAAQKSFKTLSGLSLFNYIS